MAKAEKRQISLRLIHDGTQPGTPLPEKLRFGLQDTKAEVHPGTAGADGTLRFDFAVEVKGAEPVAPGFGGAFVHGPPTGRFLYLSWKREGCHAAPWGWRIKIPLAGIGWADIRAAGARKCLAADVRGFRPHAHNAFTWRLEELS